MKTADTTREIKYLTEFIFFIIALLNSGQSQAVPGPADTGNPDKLSALSLILSPEPEFLTLRKGGFDPAYFTGSGLQQFYPNQSVTFRMKENSKGVGVTVVLATHHGIRSHPVTPDRIRDWFTRNQF